MKILETQVYRGASYWAPEPVIRVSLEVAELETRLTNQIPDFCEKFTTTLPTMQEHRCSDGNRGGFLERVRLGTSLGHIAQHTALEIQNMAGRKVACGKECLQTGLGDETQPGVYHVVYSYEQ